MDNETRMLGGAVLGGSQIPGPRVQALPFEDGVADPG